MLSRLEQTMRANVEISQHFARGERREAIEWLRMRENEPAAAPPPHVGGRCGWVFVSSSSDFVHLVAELVEKRHTSTPPTIARAQLAMTDSHSSVQHHRWAACAAFVAERYMPIMRTLNVHEIVRAALPLFDASPNPPPSVAHAAPPLSLSAMAAAEATRVCIGRALLQLFDLESLELPAWLEPRSPARVVVSAPVLRHLVEVMEATSRDPLLDQTVTGSGRRCSLRLCLDRTIFGGLPPDLLDKIIEHARRTRVPRLISAYARHFGAAARRGANGARRRSSSSSSRLLHMPTCVRIALSAYLQSSSRATIAGWAKRASQLARAKASLESCVARARAIEPPTSSSSVASSASSTCATPASSCASSSTSSAPPLRRPVATLNTLVVCTLDTQRRLEQACSARSLRCTAARAPHHLDVGLHADVVCVRPRHLARLGEHVFRRIVFAPDVQASEALAFPRCHSRWLFRHHRYVALSLFPMPMDECRLVFGRGVVADRTSLGALDRHAFVVIVAADSDAAPAVPVPAVAAPPVSTVGDEATPS